MLTVVGKVTTATTLDHGGAIVTETKAETMKVVIVAVDTAGLAHACGSVKAVIIAVDTAGVAHAYGSVDDSASSIVTLSHTDHAQEHPGTALPCQQRL
jgi:hypothetical protein